MTRTSTLPATFGVLATLALALVGCNGEDDAAPADHEVWVESVPGAWSRPHDDAGSWLQGIGYADGFEEATGSGGVLAMDPERTQAGANLYASGDGPIARLIDQQGQVLHTWQVPDLPPDPSFGPGHNVFRRVHLLPNGELLAIWIGRGLVKLDKDSRVLWTYPGLVHHDLAVAPNGTIWTLIREERRVITVNPRADVVDDVLVNLTANGREIRRISIIDAFLASSVREPFLSATIKQGDFMHTNSVSVLDGVLGRRHPGFTKGNLLVCLRNLDTAATIDPERGVVQWMRPFVGRAPHEPVMTAAGTMLVFDNRGNREHSQVLEFDPLAPGGTEPIWSYAGEPKERFSSFYCGTAARLPNGNTLITESTKGRVFEVTPAGEIVWAFENPARAGDRKQLIAAIYEMVRLPAEMDLGWIQD